MKTRSKPRSRQVGPVPHPQPPAAKPALDDQSQNRDLFGYCSSFWGADLTDPERLAWNNAARRARPPRRGRKRRPSGQRLFVKVSSLRLAFGLDLLRLPPPLALAGANPVGQFTITRVRGRLALRLALSAPPAGPILLYGSRPCNPGVSACCKFPRLGLLPAPVAGVSDITQLYLVKHGLPRPGQRIFIRTRYLENYLSTFALTTSALVPLPSTRKPHFNP